MSLVSGLGRLWRNLVLEPWERINEENRQFLASDAARRLDWKVALVLVTAAVALTVQHYLAEVGGYLRLASWLNWLGLQSWASELCAFMETGENYQLHELTYWCLIALFTYVAMPAFVILVIFREDLRNYGVKLRGAFSDWWLYVVMFAIMVPLVFFVSRNASFQETYPFYRIEPGEPLWPSFWCWEALYALQFIGLEFFFRGFMVHGMRHRFGFYAIFVMMVPYCMIHFGKPMPETFAAIVAGIVLGFMSLKTRSIWMGASIHISVALSMDFTSMWRQGLFP